jgi:hypothetical protein
MTICASARFTTALRRCRVVWGVSLVIATFEPMRAFVSVDFPALGRPTSATKPLRMLPGPREGV